MVYKYKSKSFRNGNKFIHVVSQYISDPSFKKVNHNTRLYKFIYDNNKYQHIILMNIQNMYMYGSKHKYSVSQITFEGDILPYYNDLSIGIDINFISFPSYIPERSFTNIFSYITLNFFSYNPLFGFSKD